jgi:O-antigen ligase
VGFITFISFFDVKKIAVRFIELAPKDADSFTPRLIGYFDSIIILLTRPLGISVGTFGQYYSNKNMIGKEQDSYAHNLFMELISSFGIFGVVLCFILIYVILFEYNFIVRNQKKIFSDPLFFAVIALLLFFFFETQFSFTLNTHKGFYFSLAMYSVFKYKFLLQKKEEVT